MRKTLLVGIQQAEVCWNVEQTIQVMAYLVIFIIVFIIISFK